jgi:hypothetical protein
MVIAAKEFAEIPAEMTMSSARKVANGGSAIAAQLEKTRRVEVKGIL